MFSWVSEICSRFQGKSPVGVWIRCRSSAGVLKTFWHSLVKASLRHGCTSQRFPLRRLSAAGIAIPPQTRCTSGWKCSFTIININTGGNYQKSKRTIDFWLIVSSSVIKITFHWCEKQEKRCEILQVKEMKWWKLNVSVSRLWFGVGQFETSVIT